MTHSIIFAIDNFDPAGAAYMRDMFLGVVEPGHPLHARWPELAVGLLVGATPVKGSDIRRAKRLKYIVRHGAGFEKVDIEACKEMGVVVCNTPGVNATSVSEVALMLACAASKSVVEVSRQIRSGEKLNKTFASLHTAQVLTGKTVGILGGGAIGFKTAQKFYGAFDAKIIMYDPFVPNDSAVWAAIPHSRAASVEELLPNVDVLSLHLPLLPTTRNLITMASFKTMKPTAIIVNTARGGIINEDDLFAALRTGVIAAAGIDAWVSEPPTRAVYGDALDLPNLTFTPHIGAAPSQVQTAVCKSMCDHMYEMAVEGKEPKDRVA